jgi:periplasmic mercuric ion binding protein
MKKLMLVALAAAATSMPAAAAEKTIVLSVPGMNCDLCPITIKKAISKVAGVKSVDASYEKKEAVVTFDDAKTTVEALTKATASAGYPSSLAR